MVLWNPALIVGLCARGDSRAVRANDGHLVCRVDFLRATGGSFRSLSSFSTATLLWEQSCNPGVVDKVASAGERCEKEEIEEDAADA